jgi:hypothetical protein
MVGPVELYVSKSIGSRSLRAGEHASAQRDTKFSHVATKADMSGNAGTRPDRKLFDGGIDAEAEQSAVYVYRINAIAISYEVKVGIIGKRSGMRPVRKTLPDRIKFRATGYERSAGEHLKPQIVAARAVEARTVAVVTVAFRKSALHDQDVVVGKCDMENFGRFTIVPQDRLAVDQIAYRYEQVIDQEGMATRDAQIVGRHGVSKRTLPNQYESFARLVRPKRSGPAHALRAVGLRKNEIAGFDFLDGDRPGRRGDARPRSEADRNGQGAADYNATDIMVVARKIGADRECDAGVVAR